MTIINPMDNTTSELRPRKYQEEIFERAQKENVIAALNTGSGKTLIGLLLIKWISALESSGNKLIVFLVPRVALVEQQAKYLRDNTPLRIEKLYGALDISLSDRMRWKKKLGKCDVIVMTPQILVNFITHSLWSLRQVALLVFDECHHARKNHAYNVIMQEYFHIKEVKARPKVFGMTASPVWNTKDPVGSLLTLETNLDSVIISVREHVDELAAHAPRPSEMISIFPAPPDNYDFHDPSFLRCLSVISLTTWEHFEVPWSSLVMRHDATLYNLGPYCASLYLYLEVRHALEGVRMELRTTEDTEMEVLEYVASPSAPRRNPPEEIHLIRDILSEFESFFWKEGCPNMVPIPVPLTWCSPKVNALKDILLEFYMTNFQAIVFVEQRQVAACLSKILPVIPELVGKIRSAHLVGQGVNSDGVSKATDVFHGDAVQAFRKGEANVLIATSVAEEGLDFPACDLVVRFDPFRHMVGYVQSRGRARNADSRFIVMIRQDDQVGFEFYQNLQAQEPEMNKAYQGRQRAAITMSAPQEDDDEDDELDALDLATRERFVVPSTGAVLSYDSAIGLLNYLCALIPCDAYTPIHKPKFTGEFQSTVKLPLSIPLPPDQLTYTGPLKCSKKEAKRAVAFFAVRRLHELEVFDEYLLPTPGRTLGEEEIVQAWLALEPRDTPAVMNVDVRYPWTIGERLWLHPLYLGGKPVTGLISGTPLPLVELRSDVLVRLGRPQAMVLDKEEETDLREMMHEYTGLGIFYRVTGSPLSGLLGLYLVPLSDNFEVDFHQIRRVVDNPRGIASRNDIVYGDEQRILVLNRFEPGRTRVLQKIRHDLSPMTTPPPGSFEATYKCTDASGTQNIVASSSYHEYWTDRWSRRPDFQVEAPKDGPLLEAPRIEKRASSRYFLDPSYRIPTIEPDFKFSSIVPMNTCGWVDMSPDVIRAFEILPALCHKITDAYRAESARLNIGLPFIPDDLLMEALTLPNVDADFNNQRLETLGDAVLDICTTVHLMLKYPMRHEGQLSTLRARRVSNKFLVTCARTVELEKFMSSERMGVDKWRFVEQKGYEMRGIRDRKSARRQIPRRGLQDCVEAILGASFIAGGIPMALKTGVCFGLSFGGIQPWSERCRKAERREIGVPALVAGLEKELGYIFENPELLVEAVTHPSFEFSSTPSYQRLEFLGDSVVKMLVTEYLYHKFPKATSHQLAFPRTKAICSPALAYIAIRQLHIQKYLLQNSIDLNNAINLYVPVLESITVDEIVRRGWRYDPPKAISDVFESVVGAVFVDLGYDLDRTGGIVCRLMDDILGALSPSIPKDPVSEVLEWLASLGCRKLKFKRSIEQKNGQSMESVSAVFHDRVVAGPIVSNSKAVARFAAAERALTALRASDEELVKKVCDCRNRMVTDEVVTALGGVDLTEEGDDLDSLDEIEELEVTNMLIVDDGV